MNICRDETLSAVTQLFASFNDVQVSGNLFATTDHTSSSGSKDDQDSSSPLLRHLKFVDGLPSRHNDDELVLEGNTTIQSGSILSFKDSLRVVASRVLRHVLRLDQHQTTTTSLSHVAPLPRLLAARLLMAMHTCDKLATPLAEIPDETIHQQPPSVLLSLFCTSRIDLLNACAHILLPFPVGHSLAPHHVPEVTTASSSSPINNNSVDTSSVAVVVDVATAADRLALEGYLHGELLSLCDGVLMQSRVLARVQGRMSMDSHLEPFESLFQRAMNEVDASLHNQDRDSATSSSRAGGDIETRGVYTAVPSGLPSALTASAPRAIVHPSGCVLEPVRMCHASVPVARMHAPPSLSDNVLICTRSLDTRDSQQHMLNSPTTNGSPTVINNAAFPHSSPTSLQQQQLPESLSELSEAADHRHTVHSVAHLALVLASHASTRGFMVLSSILLDAAKLLSIFERKDGSEATTTSSSSKTSKSKAASTRSSKNVRPSFITSSVSDTTQRFLDSIHVELDRCPWAAPNVPAVNNQFLMLPALLLDAPLEVIKTKPVPTTNTTESTTANLAAAEQGEQPNTNDGTNRPAAAALLRPTLTSTSLEELQVILASSSHPHHHHRHHHRVRGGDAESSAGYSNATGDMARGDHHSSAASYKQSEVEWYKRGVDIAALRGGSLSVTISDDVAVDDARSDEGGAPAMNENNTQTNNHPDHQHINNNVDASEATNSRFTLSECAVEPTHLDRLHEDITCSNTIMRYLQYAALDHVRNVIRVPISTMSRTLQIVLGSTSVSLFNPTITSSFSGGGNSMAVYMAVAVEILKQCSLTASSSTSAAALAAMSQSRGSSTSQRKSRTSGRQSSSSVTPNHTITSTANYNTTPSPISSSLPLEMVVSLIARCAVLGLGDDDDGLHFADSMAITDPSSSDNTNGSVTVSGTTTTFFSQATLTQTQPQTQDLLQASDNNNNNTTNASQNQQQDGGSNPINRGIEMSQFAYHFQLHPFQSQMLQSDYIPSSSLSSTGINQTTTTTATSSSPSFQTPDAYFHSLLGHEHFCTLHSKALKIAAHKRILRNKLRIAVVTLLLQNEALFGLCESVISQMYQVLPFDLSACDPSDESLFMSSSSNLNRRYITREMSRVVVVDESGNNTQAPTCDTHFSFDSPKPQRHGGARHNASGGNNASWSLSPDDQQDETPMWSVLINEGTSSTSTSSSPNNNNNILPPFSSSPQSSSTLVGVLEYLLSNKEAIASHGTDEFRSSRLEAAKEQDGLLGLGADHHDATHIFSYDDDNDHHHHHGGGSSSSTCGAVVNEGVEEEVRSRKERRLNALVNLEQAIHALQLQETTLQADLDMISPVDLATNLKSTPHSPTSTTTAVGGGFAAVAGSIDWTSLFEVNFANQNDIPLMRLFVEHEDPLYFWRSILPPSPVNSSPCYITVVPPHAVVATTASLRTLLKNLFEQNVHLVHMPTAASEVNATAVPMESMLMAEETNIRTIQSRILAKRNNNNTTAGGGGASSRHRSGTGTSVGRMSAATSISGAGTRSGGGTNQHSSKKQSRGGGSAKSVGAFRGRNHNSPDGVVKYSQLVCGCCEAALTLPLISAPFPTVLLEHLLKVELYGPDYLSASSSRSSNNTDNNNLNAQQLLSMSGIHDNNNVMDPNTMMMMSVEQIAARGKLSIPGSISRSIAGDTIASEITGAGRVLAKLLRSLGLYADPSLLADPTSIHPIVRKVMGSALPHYLQSFIESHLHSGLHIKLARIAEVDTGFVSPHNMAVARPLSGSILRNAIPPPTQVNASPQPGVPTSTVSVTSDYLQPRFETKSKYVMSASPQGGATNLGPIVAAAKKAASSNYRLSGRYPFDDNEITNFTTCQINGYMVMMPTELISGSIVLQSDNNSSPTTNNNNTSSVSPTNHYNAEVAGSDDDDDENMEPVDFTADVSFQPKANYEYLVDHLSAVLGGPNYCKRRRKRPITTYVGTVVYEGTEGIMVSVTKCIRAYIISYYGAVRYRKEVTVAKRNPITAAARRRRRDDHEHATSIQQQSNSSVALSSDGGAAATTTTTRGGGDKVATNFSVVGGMVSFGNLRDATQITMGHDDKKRRHLKLVTMKAAAPAPPLSQNITTTSSTPTAPLLLPQPVQRFYHIQEKLGHRVQVLFAQIMELYNNLRNISLAERRHHDRKVNYPSFGHQQEEIGHKREREVAGIRVASYYQPSDTHTHQQDDEQQERKKPSITPVKILLAELKSITGDCFMVLSEFSEPTYTAMFRTQTHQGTLPISMAVLLLQPLFVSGLFSALEERLATVRLFAEKLISRFVPLNGFRFTVKMNSAKSAATTTATNNAAAGGVLSSSSAVSNNTSAASGGNGVGGGGGRKKPVVVWPSSFVREDGMRVQVCHDADSTFRLESTAVTTTQNTTTNSKAVVPPPPTTEVTTE